MAPDYLYAMDQYHILTYYNARTYAFNTCCYITRNSTYRINSWNSYDPKNASNSSTQLDAQ